MASLVVAIPIILGAIAFGTAFLFALPEELEKDRCRTPADRVTQLVCAAFCGAIGTGGLALASEGAQGGPVFEILLGVIVAAVGYGFAWLRFSLLASHD